MIPGESNEIPDGKLHPTGPHDAPNANMYNRSIATLAQPSALWAGQLSENSPTRTAMIAWQMVMSRAPPRSSHRRPRVSMVQTLVHTPTSCVTLRIPDMRSCMSVSKPMVSNRVGE